MPTHEEDDLFLRDFDQLTPDQKDRFLRVLQRFIEDLERDGIFRRSLRVKPLKTHPGVWELTWEGNDGRATFSYGEPKLPGKRHIRWRRIGGHAILDNP